MQCPSLNDYFDLEYRNKEHELALAVTLKDSDKVQALVSQGVNKNGLYKGKSLLSWAAGGGDVGTMRLLLDNTEDVAQPDPPAGNIGYFVVVREGGDEAAERLRTTSEEATTPEGMSDLEWDVELNNLSAPQDQEEDVWSSQYKWYARILAETSQMRQEELSSSRASKVDAQDPRGRCALHYAAEAGQLDTVVYLIESGSKVDPVDRESITPLHLAAAHGHLYVVETLLRQKAHINAQCTDKMTPLHYSASRGHVDVVSMLVARGANVNALDSGDRTPLKLAVSRDLYQVVKVLVDSGARVNIEDVKGYTALCEAVWQKNVPMARLLLGAGAKLTPAPSLLHYSILHRHSEMVAPLLEAGAMVNVRDDHGSTPLIVAAVTAQPSIVKLLLKHGAHVDMHGGLSGKTALVTVLQTDRIPTDLGVVLELIEGGADLNKSCWDMTPINAALCHRKTTPLDLLENSLLESVDSVIRQGVRESTGLPADTPIPVCYSRRNVRGLGLVRVCWEASLQHINICQTLANINALFRRQRLQEIAECKARLGFSGDTRGIGVKWYQAFLAASCWDSNKQGLTSSDWTNGVKLSMNDQSSDRSAESRESPLQKPFLQEGQPNRNHPSQRPFVKQHTTRSVPPSLTNFVGKVEAACLLLRHGASISPPRGVRSQDPLTFARAAGALSAVQIIVLSGYDLWKNCPEITMCEHVDTSDPSNVQGWLSIQKFLPLRLSELARVTVRSLWSPRRHTMADYVRSIGLPPLLRQYLMFSDVEAEHCDLRSSAIRSTYSVFWQLGD